MATLSSNNDFHSEQQTQHLQDTARHGSYDELYCYDGQQNAYPHTCLSNAFEELDPATLLESLANFEHPTSSSELPAVSESHFENLLQAVASADKEEAAQASRGQNKSPAKRSTISDQVASPKNKTTTPRKKRKRRLVEDEDSEGDTVGFIVTSKRHKLRQDEDAEQLAIQREIWGPEDGEENDQDEQERQTPIATAGARVAGVQSAAALFRRPSIASKKYTRQPMSKLFTSLEQPTEQFLRLQAAAKNYMLDDRYPERSDCVGNRGKGDTDMVKLRLFACVKSFLEDEGWGEKCFGASAPGAESRKLKWPMMKNKVISSVTPLMRRMVTNERQRLYASESRKQKTQTSSKTTSGVKKRPREGSPTEEDASCSNGDQRLSAPSPSPYPKIDPKLNHYHYDVDESSIAQQPSVSEAEASNIELADGEFSTGVIVFHEPAKYLVNIMHGNHRIKPEVTLRPDSCPGLSSLIQHAHTLIDDENLKVRSVKVWGPNGMIDVVSEDIWKGAVALIMGVEWTNGQVKCVVEVNEK